MEIQNINTVNEDLTASVVSRFWSYVNKEGSNGCWLWKGSVDKSNYGVFSYDCKNTKAHRISFMINKGPIQLGLVVGHSCGQKNCVNPDHLSAMTAKENAQNLSKMGNYPVGNKHWSNNNTDKMSRGESHWTKKHPELVKEKLSGENNPDSKLNTQQVLEIRSLYATGNYQQKQLAIKFGVTPPTIRDIVFKKTWTHI